LSLLGELIQFGDAASPFVLEIDELKGFIHSATRFGIQRQP
jgi:hypothetical protein